MALLEPGVLDAVSAGSANDDPYAAWMIEPSGGEFNALLDQPTCVKLMESAKQPQWLSR